ncbi:murein biosynthesis integral membrane protein MurJ [Saccharopolyspora sp. WRP15-2]|uniref:Murein biosynthesis integral membrane protein MurJ n=2 Tax=Saccharopolyspora oryzae TaxID=2997343 RepID=A0ABT4V3P9_9PSEU|nr:murein biosynthesis integral membrane protein MurJ [Saccharopolyspora oryzae]MDA3628574.1 murein biosynthesis integral membrane protein MurJ [Saccharopolyspora oryzae]
MNRNRDAGRPGERAPQPGAHPTVPIRRPDTAQPRPAPPMATPQNTRRGWHVAETQPIAAVPPEPGMDQAAEQATEQTQVIRPVSPGKGKPSLLKASGSMAVATLTSRITGFLWKLMLAGVIGFGIENDSFNVANTLPNMLFELLIGGVLTSVVVPVLVRARKGDSDGGERFVQQLMTLAAVVLAAGTLLAMIAAPLLTVALVSDSDESNRDLVTAFAYLLLPQIFFYGISALVGAILQAKQIFSPPAWAPVVNNLVVIATIGALALMPGEISLNPVSMTDPQVLVLGVGVTLGVVCQALVQLPALRRTGFRMRWRWGWDRRLSEFGGLALWMLGYVAISQIGLVALSRVATANAQGAWSTYSYVWMLLQLPYGVIGFSIMTAILPRMSAAAADGDHQRVIDDLSLGNRLSTVTLLPVSAVMTALGVPLSLALFAVKSDMSGQANTLGLALAVSAFGVLPYALTMMQMRTFNALSDARTPTLIMVVMTAAKVLMAFALPVFLAPDQVVFGLTFVNSFTFIVGWLVGEIWLRNRLGPLGSRRFLKTLAKTLTASVAGGLLCWGSVVGVDALIPGEAGAGTGWLQLLVGTVVGFAAIFGLMSVLRVAELQPAIGRLTGLLRRR